MISKAQLQQLGRGLAQELAQGALSDDIRMLGTVLAEAPD